MPKPSFDDPLLWQALARAHPLALLVIETTPPRLLRLPLRLQQQADGLWIEGHCGVGQAAGLHDGLGAQALFCGPEAYVSPSLMDGPRNVPTWNFLQLRLQGRLQLLQDDAAKQDLLLRQIADLEPGYAAQWREQDPGWRAALLGAIVGLRIQVEAVQPRAKLGQQDSLEERRRIAAALPALAPWMQSLQLL